MTEFNFTSTLPRAYRNDLEQLLFFNPNQERVLTAILRSIKRYGQPKLVERNGKLRVDVGDCPDAQGLYAIETHPFLPRLIGCIIYVRDRPENLTIVHLAVTPAHQMSESADSIPLAVQLVSQVVAIAKQIKGITMVTFFYKNGVRHKLKIISTPRNDAGRTGKS